MENSKRITEKLKDKAHVALIRATVDLLSFDDLSLWEIRFALENLELGDILCCLERDLFEIKLTRKYGWPEEDFD